MKTSQGYSAFTEHYTGIAQELSSTVGVAFSSAPKEEAQDFMAVWDTGATVCAITKKVADSLGIAPIGRIEVAGVHGIERVNQYIVDLHLPNGTVVSGVDVSELSESAGCDVLIGMDVITLGDFAISNLHGKTVFSFRVPSMDETDYTK